MRFENSWKPSNSQIWASHATATCYPHCFSSFLGPLLGRPPLLQAARFNVRSLIFAAFFFNLSALLIFVQPRHRKDQGAQTLVFFVSRVWLRLVLALFLILPAFGSRPRRRSIARKGLYDYIYDQHPQCWAFGSRVGPRKGLLCFHMVQQVLPGGNRWPETTC